MMKQSVLLLTEVVIYDRTNLAKSNYYNWRATVFHLQGSQRINPRQRHCTCRVTVYSAWVDTCCLIICGCHPFIPSRHAFPFVKCHSDSPSYFERSSLVVNLLSHLQTDRALPLAQQRLLVAMPIWALEGVQRSQLTLID